MKRKYKNVSMRKSDESIQGESCESVTLSASVEEGMRDSGNRVLTSVCWSELDGCSYETVSGTT